jgi:dTDP-4-amino-4,6-dideoxygalactose transaminase
MSQYTRVGREEFCNMSFTIPMVDLKVQFNSIKEDMTSAVLSVMETTNFILGPKVKALEELVAAYHGVKHAVAVASGTDALHLALISAGVKHGDEVITSPFTFIATAEAISYVGATPVFVDIDPETFNIDVNKVKAAITSKTKAIVPVHLYGQPVDMGAIMEIAKKNSLRVVEDCAQSFGADYQGKKTGSFGDFGCFSFFPSKNLGGYGDGGMVITDDRNMAEHLHRLRNHGSHIRYYHDEIGFNSRLDEIQAAILQVKFKHIDEYNDKRRKNALFYNACFVDSGVNTPSEMNGTKHVYHQYTIKVKNRDAVKKRLDDSKVTSSMIYYPVPLHLQKAYAYLGLREGCMPVTEQICQEVLSLPMYPELAETQIRQISDAVKQAL